MEALTSDTRGLSADKGKRGEPLICLLTSSIPPTLNTVDAGMHRGSAEPVKLPLRTHIRSILLSVVVKPAGLQCIVGYGSLSLLQIPVLHRA